MNDFLREKFGLVIVLALMVAYSAYFSALSIQRHYTFRTSASDMGQMDQALWNTLHGHLLEDTRQDPDSPTAHQAPRLTDHVEPIFIPVSLVYLIYDDIASIFVLQSIAIALGAIPIYWIAKRRLKNEWAGVAFAAMYLLLPALEAANLAEFHAVTLAPAPLLFAYNYAEERAWKRFALFSLIALAVKEDMALLVFAMAVWAAVRSTVNSPTGMLRDQQSTDKRVMFRVSRFTINVSILPVIVAIVSVVWFVIALYVIVPHFSPRNESVYIGRYPQSPLALLLGLFIPEKIQYVVGLLLSGGLIAVFDPVVLLVGSPSLILNLLSSYSAQYSGTYHYSAPVAPYFVLAAIGGAAWLRDRMTRGLPRFALALPVALALVIALGYHAVAGYTPFGGEYFWPETTPHQQNLARFLSEIPPDVPVSTTKTIFPHLSHRRFLYRFPTIMDAEYILLDISQSTTRMPVDFRVDYDNALKQGYGVRDALDGYILLQRGLTNTQLPDGFYTFVRGCECKRIQNPVTVNFDGKIRFLGYDVKQDDWGRVYLRTYWRRLAGFDGLNYALHPFYVGPNGAVREDAPIPDMLIHFWYPTSRWQPDEIIVAETTPVDLGAGARLQIGVFFGATWDDPEFRLTPSSDAPLAADGISVWLGDLVRDGKGYRVSLPAGILP